MVHAYVHTVQSTRLSSGVMTQPLKTHMKKGSGNIVYNELSQILECGATNQIAPFGINAQSAQFIINAARMPRRVLWWLWTGRRYQVSPVITSPWYQSDTVPSVCSFLSFKFSLEVKMCWLAYLLAMGSHFVLSRHYEKSDQYYCLLCKF